MPRAATPASVDAVSLAPLSDSSVRRAVRVLAMVHELHKAGYQRLRVSAGYTLDLRHWRCHIGPATAFHDDGWTPDRGAEMLLYTTAHAHEYFGWGDAMHDDARHLAAKFIARYPGAAQEAQGEDWAYAGWFVRILGRAEHGVLPEFFGGLRYHQGEEATQLPPALCIGKPIPAAGQRLISHEELKLADLPAPDADYEDLWPFCLTFDGYRACHLAGADPHVVVAASQSAGLENTTMECLRITAFMLQRAIKWDQQSPPDGRLIEAIREVVEVIRRRLTICR